MIATTALTLAATLALLAAPPGDAASPEPGGGPDEAEASAPDVAGRWAMKHLTTGISEVPVLGRLVTANRVLLVVDVTQDGSRVVLEEQVCRVDVKTSLDVVRTVFDDRFFAAVSGGRREARVFRAGDAVRLVAPKHWDLHGAELADPTSDPLPTRADDPRVTDPDQDGKPGLTVGIEGFVDGEIQVVQRGWSILDGVFLDPDHATGRIAWRTEQTVIAYSTSMLKDPPANAPHRNPNLSTFHMARLPDDATCADVLRAHRTLFASDE